MYQKREIVIITLGYLLSAVAFFLFPWVDLSILDDPDEASRWLGELTGTVLVVIVPGIYSLWKSRRDRLSRKGRKYMLILHISTAYFFFIACSIKALM